MAEVVLEKLNVNDDDYTLIKWLIENNTFVKKGEVIAEFDTSKTAVEVESPFTGKIVFNVEPGQIIKIGQVFCNIFGENEVSNQKNKKQKNVFSFESNNTSLKPKKNQIGFKTNRSYGKNNQVQENKERNFKLSQSLKKIDPRKAAEIENLTIVNQTGLVSTIALQLQAFDRYDQTEGFFSENISDIIIFETSKIINKYPKINSRFDSEKGIFLYKKIQFGYSIDNDDNLIVYNLGNTSENNFNQIRGKILDAIESHVLKKIRSNYLKPSTITLTDLSNSKVDFFIPLINGEQSIIIGFTKSKSNLINLIASFDHRVLSGKYVSDFLYDLSINIQKYQKEESCFFCNKTISHSKDLKEKGFIKVISSDGIERNCCRICFEGW